MRLLYGRQVGANSPAF